MLGEQVNVARIEPLGLVEVGLALVPLASPPIDVGKRFRNLTAIGQKRTRLLEITLRSAIIFQASVVVKALGQYGLAEIRLKRKRGFGCLPRLFTQNERWLKSQRDISACFDV